MNKKQNPCGETELGTSTVFPAVEIKDPWDLVKIACMMADPGEKDLETDDLITQRASDIPKMDWLFQDIWVNYTGSGFDPKDMGTEHLINTIKYLERRAPAYKLCYEYAFLANMPAPDDISTAIFEALKSEIELLKKEKPIEWIKRMPVYIALDTEYKGRLKVLQDRLSQKQTTEHKRTKDPVKMCQVMKMIITGNKEAGYNGSDF